MTTKKKQILSKFYEDSISKCESEKKRYLHIPMAGKAVAEALDILIEHCKEQLEQVNKMEETK